MARANYLALDRPDICFPVKELCRRMSAPTVADWEHLMRLCKFLVAKRRLVQKFPFQAEVKSLSSFGDADFAGCRWTRKSTSGGCITLGGHYLKGWSKTQAVIALSSAESELAALVRCTCESLGILALYRDFGMTMTAMAQQRRQQSR